MKNLIYAFFGLIWAVWGVKGLYLDAGMGIHAFAFFISVCGALLMGISINDYIDDKIKQLKK